MLDANHIAALHDQANRLWHVGQSLDPGSPLDVLILAQHRANYDLWHEEDKARDPIATDAAIATLKRSIDCINQQRNDLIEQIDRTLLESLPPQNTSAPLHSETPGLMIDRLSILSLKLHHTAEESHRSDATSDHRQRNAARLAILEEQRSDLAASLDALAQDLAAGQRRFKLYRQLKMYNDPTLNPVLYRQPGSPTQG